VLGSGRGDGEVVGEREDVAVASGRETSGSRTEYAESQGDVAIPFQSCHNPTYEVRVKSMSMIALVLVACGKPAPAPSDVGPVTGAGQGSDAVEPAAPDGQAPGAEDGALAAADVGPGEDGAEVAQELQLLQRLGALEVPGMSRSRSHVQNDYVTLQFETTTPNAKGNTASIEVTIGLCSGCAPVTKEALDARKEQSLGQLGELHAKNPGLVFELDELELMPQRKAAASYVRSFVDDGVTRAAMHTLEVTFIGSDKSLRFLAYPRSGFPQSQAELDEAFTRAELTQAVRAIFAAAASVIWPE